MRPGDNCGAPAADVRRNPQSLRGGIAELSPDALREFPSRRSCLRFSMEAREGGLMEWMVHEVRPRYNTADWSRGSEAGRGHHPGARNAPRATNHRRAQLLRILLSLPISKCRDSRFTRSWIAGAGKSGEALSATSSGCGIASCRHHADRIGGAILLDRMVHSRLRQPQRISVHSPPDRASGVFIYRVSRRGPRHLGFRGGAHQVAL